MRSSSESVMNEVIESGAQHGGFRRRDMIEQIVRINASATADFLNRFADNALQKYLDHLHATQQPRGRAAVWVRSGDTPAANTFSAAW